jgi:hypothetical protein
MDVVSHLEEVILTIRNQIEELKKEFWPPSLETKILFERNLNFLQHQLEHNENLCNKLKNKIK